MLQKIPKAIQITTETSVAVITPRVGVIEKTRRYKNKMDIFVQPRVAKYEAELKMLVY